MVLDSIPYGSRDLKLGAHPGTDIQDLQVKLVAFASNSSHIVCDGQFSVSTQDAILNFCKLQGIKAQKIADAKLFEAIEAWINSELEFIGLFQSTYPCHCSTEALSYQKEGKKFWDKNIRNQSTIQSGEVITNSTCTGFGSGLAHGFQFDKGSNTSGKITDSKGNFRPPEKPGFNKLLLWAVLGARKIIQEKLGTKSLGLRINNGYRCQVNYFQIIAQREEECKDPKKNPKKLKLREYLEKYPVALGNHLGNAVDLKFLATMADKKTPLCSPAQARDILKNSYGYLETFDTKPNFLRVEPRGASPKWTHIDTTTYEYQVYVKTVQDALEPRYTPGQSNLP